jgi:glycosyltransferase involved in cell wall biosynthesis
MVSIITPSLNQAGYLACCCASVADQGGTHEHIVVDGGSSDGSVAWLQQQAGVRWISGPDHGMYDAINKGFGLACGEVLAYLNCDEQYLPGALASVEAAFEAHPEVDIVYGDALLLHPDGSLAAFRKAYPLRRCYVASSHLYVLSCATFFRKSLLDRVGGYDLEWRTAGDAAFVLRALEGGAVAFHLRRYVASFTLTDDNLGATPLAFSEHRQLFLRQPCWLRALSPFLAACRLLEKALAGAYRQSWPLRYSIYTGPADARTDFAAASGAYRWPRGRRANMALK